MSRPSRIILEEGIAAWDGDIDDLFSLLFNAPFPIHIEDDVTTATTNFDPADYEDCLLMIGATGAARLYASDGTDWILYDKVAANVSDSTATTVSALAVDFNTLTAAMIAAGQMEES